MKLVIVAGGTGGHIYPGIAIAEEIKSRDPQTDILFVGSAEGMEQELVSKAGFSLKIIKARALLRKLSYKAISAPFICIIGFFQSLFFLKKFVPDRVLSTGGYVSLPVVLAAAMLRIPIYLHEQNVLPGVVNRFCARFAEETYLSFVQTQKHLNGTVVGNPVRANIVNLKKLDPKTVRRVLVMGGSQGARSINEKVLAARKNLPENVNVVHLVGQRDFKPGWDTKNYQAFSYIDNMEKVLAETDIVISRAGATAIAEFLVASIPMVLIPFPYAAENHQLINAEVVALAGAARVILDQDFSSELFLKLINQLEEEYDKMKMACNAMARPNAAREIVDNLYV